MSECIPVPRPCRTSDVMRTPGFLSASKWVIGTGFPAFVQPAAGNLHKKKSRQLQMEGKRVKTEAVMKEEGWEKKGSTAHQQRLRQWSDQPSANLTTFQTSSSAIAKYKED